MSDFQLLEYVLAAPDEAEVDGKCRTKGCKAIVPDVGDYCGECRAGMADDWRKLMLEDQ